MDNSLGTLLQSLRTQRHIPMTRLAERAGITRMTLNRWETGRFQPRLPELEAVLAAMEASSAERMQVLSLMAAPRAVKQVRAETEASPDPFEPAVNSLPAAGDLLRAMRLRRGLSQEQVAAALRVHGSAVSCWEQSRTVPTSDRLEALFVLLGAHPEERATLADGRLFLVPPHEAKISVEGLEQRLAQLEAQIDRGDNTLMDLRLQMLEAQVWPAAGRCPSARLLPARTYRTHSRWLWWRGRRQEAMHYAEKALATTPSPSEEAAALPLLMDVVHILGGVIADNKTPGSLRRAQEHIKGWLPAAEQATERTILCRDMADYLNRSKEPEGALRYSADACGLAEQTEDRSRIELAAFTRASVLIETGRPAEALPLLRAGDLGVPIQNLNEAYLWCEAFHGLGDHVAAAEWLNRAYEIIAACDLTHYKRDTDGLAQRL